MTALEFLGQAFLMAVVTLGAWTAMADGMVLGWFRKWIERTALVKTKTKNVYTGRTMNSTDGTTAPVFPVWVRNPVASCPRCMCSFWGIVALLLFGFGVGIEFDFTPSGMLTFNDAMELVPVDEPWIRVDWSRLAQIPALILAACGIQEMLHRP